MTDIERIIYVEDSDDEAFLTRILLDRERVTLSLDHYPRFDRLEQELEQGVLDDLGATLVVVDLNLKVTNGTDAVRRLRELPAARDAVIGVCSGSEDPADRREVEAANADFFVGKPLDAACLERICTLVPRLEFVRSDDGTVGLALTGPDS